VLLIVAFLASHVLTSVLPAEVTEDNGVQKRVAAEAVGPMNTDTGHFSRRIEASHCCATIGIAVNAAHCIVLSRLDR